MGPLGWLIAGAIAKEIFDPCDCQAAREKEAEQERRLIREAMERSRQDREDKEQQKKLDRLLGRRSY